MAIDAEIEANLQKSIPDGGRLLLVDEGYVRRRPFIKFLSYGVPCVFILVGSLSLLGVIEPHHWRGGDQVSLFVQSLMVLTGLAVLAFYGHRIVYGKQIYVGFSDNYLVVMSRDFRLSSIWPVASIHVVRILERQGPRKLFIELKRKPGFQKFPVFQRQGSPYLWPLVIKNLDHFARELAQTSGSHFFLQSGLKQTKIEMS